MRMHRIAKAAPSTLFSALAFAATFGSGACGSSDSSSDNGGDARGDGGVVKQPGAIVSVSPAENDDNVSIHAPITIEYNVPVQVTPSSMTLSGPNAAVIATTVQQSDDGKTVTVTPVAEIPAPTKLTLTINEIRTREGAVAEKKSWSWTLPAWLRVGKPVSSKAQAYLAANGMAIDSKDRISVFTGGDVAVNTIDPTGGDWTRRGGPLNSGQTTSLETLAVNKDGDPFVAFVGKVETQVQGLSGTSWVDLGGITHGAPAGALGFQNGPSIAVEPTTGKVLLAHTGVTDNGLKMYVKSFANNIWTTEGDPLNVNSDSAFFPNIAVSKTGKRYAMYQSSSSPSNAYVLTWTGSAWTSVGSPGAVGSFRSALVVDANDKPVVFGCFPDLQFRRGDGAQWSTIGSPIGACPNQAATAYIARNNEGRLFAAWSNNQQGDVHVAEVTTSGWTALSAPVPFGGGLVGGIVIDSRGVPVISWGAANGIQVARLNK
ncbi:Ig-like domain-containing protein [Pendulispora brunnea]|uniref:Ig-like domain-containing protein n=1 Tax=Pendulispora brunnea TaxID=2905690 RepID=A0ABZ2JWP3_9BACT